MVITTGALDNAQEVGQVAAASHCGTGFLTGFLTPFFEFFGIENRMYANKVEKARRFALRRLIDQAQQLQADGVIRLRYQVTGRTVLAYGTAVTGAGASAQPDGRLQKLAALRDGGLITEQEYQQAIAKEG